MIDQLLSTDPNITLPFGLHLTCICTLDLADLADQANFDSASRLVRALARGWQMGSQSVPNGAILVGCR